MNAQVSRRRFLSGTIGVAAGIGGLSLASCAAERPGSSAGPAPGATVGAAGLRVAWWGNDARHEKMQEVLRLFAAKYSQVTMEREFSGFEGYFDKLATQTSGGNAPDAFQLLQEYVPDYGGRRQLLDLGPYVGGLLNLDEIDEASVAAGRIDDTLMAVPLGDSSPAIVFNATMLDGYGLAAPEPDWTWDDFAALARDVYARSGGTVYGCTDPGAATFVLEVWMRQRGKELYALEGGLGFEKADLVEWFEFWQDLRDDGGLVPPEVNAAAIGSGQEPLVTGQSAMWSNYPNQLTIVTPLLPDGVTLGAALIPNAPDQERPGQFIRAVTWEGAFAKTSAPAETVALLDFMLNDEAAGAVLGTEFGVPPSRAVREAITPSLTPPEQVFVSYLDLVAQNSTPMTIPIPTGGGEVYGALYAVNEEVAFGRVTIDEAVDRFFNEAERALR